jgi:GntR family transcriptional regulator of vanillate catabolism
MRQNVQAVLKLREMILDGHFAPGERLSELTLVKLIGVSRTPLREALVRLEAEGLVESLPGGGFTVRAFSAEDVFDAIEIRGTFEGLAARKAAEQPHHAALLAKARAHLAAIDQVVDNKTLTINDFSLYLQINEKFHAVIVDMAGSALLREQMERAVSLPFASPSSFIMAEAELPESHDILFVAQDQHRCLIEAIEAGEGARAEALAREHARIAKRNLQIAFRNRNALDRVLGSTLLSRAAAV